MEWEKKDRVGCERMQLFSKIWLLGVRNKNSSLAKNAPALDLFKFFFFEGGDWEKITKSLSRIFAHDKAKIIDGKAKEMEA